MQKGAFHVSFDFSSTQNGSTESHLLQSHYERSGHIIKIIILKNDSKLLNQSCEENDSNNPKVVNLVNS